MPEHRLYLLALVCFSIKWHDKTKRNASDFTQDEIELLVGDKSDAYSHLASSAATAHHLGSLVKPDWLSEQSWHDALATSFLADASSPLSKLAASLSSADVQLQDEWRAWYEHSRDTPMPKISMRRKSATSAAASASNELKRGESDSVELSSFRQLVVNKTLRPDTYMFALDKYVTETLELRLVAPDATLIFGNRLYNTFIINMGSHSNISSSSSMGRIHKKYTSFC